MHFTRLASLTALTVVAIAGPALGTITVGVDVTTSGGSVANALNVTTTDYGWSGAQLYIRLFDPVFGGSVINLDPALGGVDSAPTQAQINTNPALLFDTFYGVVGQSDMSLGGAPELGGGDPLELGPTEVSASWMPPAGLNPPSNQLAIGNIVLSDNAFGVWSLKVSEPFQPTYTFMHGVVDDGELSFFLDGDVNLDGFVGIEDLNIILGEWNHGFPGLDPISDPRSDPSGDGFVGIEDLGIVLGRWNSGKTEQPWLEGTTADLDGDGFVGINDFNIILGNWHQNVGPGDLLAGDPSGDGFVGFDDMVLVNTLWHTGTPPSIVIPEPAGLTLLSLGTLAALRSRRA